MLQNENVYVAVEGEEETWIQFKLERMSGRTLPFAVTPEPFEPYMLKQGRDDFRLSQVRLGEIVKKLRSDELGATHVTIVSQDGSETHDKKTFLQFMV
jgi:hypothetical protein